MNILFNLFLLIIIFYSIYFIFDKNKLKEKQQKELYNFKILLEYFYKIILILLTFTLIYMNFNYTHWNGISKKNDNTFFKKFLNRLYFSSNTLSSVGYGDITAKSNKVRLITIFYNVLVLLIILEFIQLNIVIKHI